MRSDDGGTAFPTEHYGVRNDGTYAIQTSNGMSLRDWFAGQALANLAAHWDQYVVNNDEVRIAERCYHLADAMLKEREKGRRA